MPIELACAALCPCGVVAERVTLVMVQRLTGRCVVVSNRCGMWRARCSLRFVSLLLRLVYVNWLLSAVWLVVF